MLTASLIDDGRSFQSLGAVTLNDLDTVKVLALGTQSSFDLEERRHLEGTYTSNSSAR